MAKSSKSKPLPKPSSRGGKRPGAGRKPGQGRYGEGTTVVRVPNSQIVSVNKFLEAYEKRVAGTRKAAKKLAGQMMLPLAEPPAQRIPLYGYSISAGFPSPADDYIEDRLDLNQLLVSNQPATFFLRVKGDYMINAGIHDGDIIVVDRSVQPVDRSVVVAVVDGELTVKRLIMRSGMAELHAENPKYAPICFQNGQELSIWGVVTTAVHQVK
jgi:DNA polymerase V